MNERAVEIRTIEKAAQGDSEMLCQRLNLPQAIAPIGVQIEQKTAHSHLRRSIQASINFILFNLRRELRPRNGVSGNQSSPVISRIGEALVHRGVES